MKYLLRLLAAIFAGMAAANPWAPDKSPSREAFYFLVIAVILMNLSLWEKPKEQE